MAVNLPPLPPVPLSPPPVISSPTISSTGTPSKKISMIDPHKRYLFADFLFNVDKRDIRNTIFMRAIKDAIKVVYGSEAKDKKKKLADLSLQFIKVFFVIYSNPINDGFGFGYSSTIESTILIKYYKLFIIEMFKKVGNIDELIKKFTDQKDKIKKIRGDSNIIIPAEINIIKQVKKNNSNHKKINDLIRIREDVITNGKKDVRDIYVDIFGLPP
jgi:hypothetical protein